MGNDQISVEAASRALRALDHLCGVRPWRNAHQNALLRAEVLGDAILLQVAFQLPVDHIRREDQRNFTKLGKLLLLLRQGLVDVGGAIHAQVGRRVDDDDFVGLADEAERNRLGNVLAGDALHLLAALLNVLKIHRSDDIDSGGEQLLDVLPALRMRTAGRIVPGQAIDQTYRRTAAQDGFHIHRGHAFGIAERDDFQGLEKRFYFRRSFGLHRAHDHVLSAALAAPSFVEHPERLADPRAITQENFEAALMGILFFFLALPEKLLRVGSSGF